jgi:phosphomannomutase
MQHHGCLIGGEGNGGVILPHVSYVRDSLVGMALALELLATPGRKLSQVVNQIPAYAIVKDKLPIAPGMAEQATRRLAEIFAVQRLDRSDGIRIDFDADRKWVHLRPSNTEPILRIIAEAPDHAAAHQLIDTCRRAIG